MPRSSKFLVIPAIDILGGKCVRLIQGDYGRSRVYSDSPAAQASAWAEQGAKLLHVVDLDGAREGSPVNLKTVREIVKAVKIPCELGGGIRTLADAEKVFGTGISRIIIGTSACRKPRLAGEFAEKFSPEKIIAGIDAREGKVAVSGWTESTDADPFSLARLLAAEGICRFIYTDISTDGMLSGPNLKSIEKFCASVKESKVIASGGVSSAKDIKDLANLAAPNLEGVIVGKALYEGKVRLDFSSAAGRGRKIAP